MELLGVENSILGLRDHMKNWPNERCYRKNFTLADEDDEKLISEPLRDFSVWRWLDEKGRKDLRRVIRDFPKEGEFSKNVGDCIKNLGKQKSGWWASGMSKALWFASKHEYPMYDRFTAAAFKKLDGTDARERCISFYQKLEDSCYLDLKKEFDEMEMPEALRTVRFDRFIDKSLMVAGLYRYTKKSFKNFDISIQFRASDTSEPSTEYCRFAKHWAERFKKTGFVNVLTSES